MDNLSLPEEFAEYWAYANSGPLGEAVRLRDEIIRATARAEALRDAESKYKADADRLAEALADEPLGFISRADLQLNVMVNLERLIKRLSKNNSLRYWWDHSKNWVRVQAILNGNTLKAGSTSSAAQCQFIGVDPDGDTFTARTALATHERINHE